MFICIGMVTRTYWPDDMETYDYSSPQFIHRLKRMIRKLGECWDTDPRVAHVEMGIIGKWGEHHSPSPTNDVEKILGEEFQKAFTHKKVMVRHAWEFNTYKFGIYWDSWAHQDQMISHGQPIYNLGDRWKTEIIGGEAAYNWGDWHIQPGDDPTDTMVDPNHRDFLIDTIRWLHCTQLRWVANYDQNNSAARAGAEKVQKVFGYRYVIDQALTQAALKKGRNSLYPLPDEIQGQHHSITIGQSNFHCWMKQTMLYGAPVSIASIFEPGCPATNGKSRHRSILFPLKPFRPRVLLNLDCNIASGHYKLALAVLDPAGRLPSLRFAIKNYLKGGETSHRKHWRRIGYPVFRIGLYSFLMILIWINH